MCIFYVYIHLLSERRTRNYIVHSLSPLKSRTDNSPVIFVTINHILYLLEIRSKINRESDRNLIMAADVENAGEISAPCSCAIVTMCSAAVHHER